MIKLKHRLIIKELLIFKARIYNKKDYYFFSYSYLHCLLW